MSEDEIDEALETFADAGYVIIENAFPAEFLARVRSVYQVQLDAHIAARGGRAALAGKTFGEGHIGFFPPLFSPLADSQVVAHPTVVALLSRLIGPDFRSSFIHTNAALPGSGVQPVHRDCLPLFDEGATVAHPIAQVVVNIPLTDFTQENGATQIWPGTHHLLDRSVEAGKRLDERAQRLPSTRLIAPAGSLVFRDLRMWHRGMPNHSDAVRTMIALVYSRAWLVDALHHRTITIPQTTWDSWSEDARRIFRHHRVVPDPEHRPRTWGKEETP